MSKDADAVATPGLSISRRLRSTPFTSRVEAGGVASYTVYNHMLLPTQIVSAEADYHHLRANVQVWDVSCERQVEVRGPAAQRLAQLLTVRDLSTFQVGRCGYAPVVDRAGRMINDPIVSRIGDDRFWFSVADSDLVLWAGGLAHGMGLDVEVFEPDVWPLAVQGPRAEDLMELVIGPAVRAIKFFRIAPLIFRGHELLIARTGWSAQGGFEIYVDDADVGAALYDELMAVGVSLDVRAGCPNLIERIEAGLLSYGNDMTRADTALEAGLDRYCSLDAPIDAIGIDALRAQRANGVTRRIAGFSISGERVPALRDVWPLSVDGRVVGQITSAAWSPRLGYNVALGMVQVEHTAIGAAVQVAIDGTTRDAVVSEVPFPGASQR